MHRAPRERANADVQEHREPEAARRERTVILPVETNAIDGEQREQSGRDVSFAAAYCITVRIRDETKCEAAVPAARNAKSVSSE